MLFERKGVSVQFKSVSKRYSRHRLTDLRIALSRLKATWFRSTEASEQNDRYIWALQEVSFEVSPGEALGIIGPNGAGKTTMLSLMAGVTLPTKGEIRIAGKVAALIQLGAGFHPELSGRENIYLNAAIMGLRRRRVEELFQKIVEFAELKEFIDMPLKRYSSGMYARLGFSVAAHLSPDVLLVDEVLAVGDLAFKSKCIEHMMRMVSEGDRTVIFVSHDLPSVEALCTRVIWLSNGQIQEVGETKEVISHYAEDFEQRKLTLDSAMLDKKGYGYGRGSLFIDSVRLYNGSTAISNEFFRGDSLTVCIDYYAKERIEKPYFVIEVHSNTGPVFSANSLLDGIRPNELAGKGTISCTFAKLNLLPGVYRITVQVLDHTGLLHLIRPQPVSGFKMVNELERYGFRGEMVNSRLTEEKASVMVDYEWSFNGVNH